MRDVTIHHMMTHLIDSGTIIPIDRFKGPAFKRIRVIGIQLTVIGMMLQIRHHEQPKRQDTPRDDTDHPKLEQIAPREELPRRRNRGQTDRDRFRRIDHRGTDLTP